MTSVDGWSLDLVEDIDIPGWVFVPEGLGRPEQEVWLGEAGQLLTEIIGSENSGDPVATAREVRTVLESGLAARADSGSYVIYQVWPVVAPAAVICHVNVVSSNDLPDWSELDGAMHAAEARYIGPGLQFSTRRSVDGPEGPVELNSVHLVFDGGDVALMLTLEESLAPLVSRALTGLTVLKDALQLTRADGTKFVSNAPVGIATDEPWPFDEARQGVS